MLQHSGGCLGVASSRILVGFCSNSKAMWGIHPKTCSARLDVQCINLPNSPNPPVNCNSFVPFPPLRGCPGTEQSGFTWSRSPVVAPNLGVCGTLKGAIVSAPRQLGCTKALYTTSSGWRPAKSHKCPQPLALLHAPTSPGAGSAASPMCRAGAWSKARLPLSSTGKGDGGRSDWLQRGVC